MNRQTEQILFSGRVQGVGFRWSVQRIARGYPVGGFVRNLISGQVELVVQGDLPDIERMVEEICARFGENISSVDRTKVAENEEFSDFRIQR